MLISLSAPGAQDETNLRRIPAFASSPEVIRAQIQSDVLSAIEKNKSSKTYGEYNTSGYTPKDVFSNVRELRDPNSWAALCQALDALPPEQLSFFEGEISQPANEGQLTCAAGLRAKLTKFWQESAIRLRQHLGQSIQKLKPGQTKVHAVECKISIADSPTVTQSQLKDYQVAFIFNDGPDPSRTPRVLDTLKSTGVRATFFHVGDKMRAHPEIDHRLVAEKHTLGTQTFGHVDLSRLDLKRAEKQIAQGRDEAEAASGVDAPFFRPPYGLLNSEVKDILKKKRMPIFQWNTDSLDWKLHDEVALYDHILQTIKKDKGGIIAFHETEEASLAVLRPLIDELKTKGYTFVVFVPCN
ncbi:MAG: polysaccharide deacetylase family protein [Bdellovibrionia bacterium]